MISIKVYRRSGLVVGVRVSGHSGSAPEGSDIVCAAVSVLVQTLHIGLDEVLGLSPTASVDRDNAVIELRWPNNGSADLQALVETIVRALRETASSYDRYVKYSEVSL